ncbi:GNAT family N-acetyltransferase [Bacillus sp. N9]
MKKNNQIIGFCRINDNASPFIAQNIYWAPLFQHDLGGIGPLGIDSNERNNGYGLAIVQAALYYLQERKIKTIVIDWTTF